MNVFTDFIYQINIITDYRSHYFGRSDVALPGFAKWFEEASKEERSHATSLMEYINKRGGDVTLNTLQYSTMCDDIYQFNQYDDRKYACICLFMSSKPMNASVKSSCGERDTWQNGLWAMQDTLALERMVSDLILKLHASSDDAHLTHVLEHQFIDEQVESIKKVNDIITKLYRVGKGLGEYMFDREEL
ncbi:yolk ferritin-like isoform X2 [Dreissena polymorpha]|uniref:yolk ferritin-like isoform X2 n=1 Tax=Dreissena polymorpha TaxID=45954 RepID=UPI002264B42B|nr:yolk ferritin-like isoform X2 [Dreissena polymorpha]